MQRDCEIMMTLDLDVWLMLCSCEAFSFRNVYVSMLIGTKQLHWHAKVIQEIPIRNTVLDDNVNSKEKRQNLKKSVSLFLWACSNSFSTIFCLFFIVVTKQSLHNDFGSRILSKMSFTSDGLKNWRHASTNAAIDYSWFFFFFFFFFLPGIASPVSWGILR